MLDRVLHPRFNPAIHTKKEENVKRNTLLKVLNPILGLFFLNQILAGIFREALSRRAFEILHERGGIVLTILVIIHVTLNWNWVKANFFKKAPAA